MIEHLLLSILGGISIATILVEKSEDYPIRYMAKPIKGLLHYSLGERFAFVMECTVCLSFWTTLICELYLYFFITNLFTWPITGLISSGISFYVIDLLNTIDRKKD